MSLFLTSFSAAMVPVLEIFLVIAVAGFLVRRRLISRELVSGLSRVTVLVFLPCLIFANVSTNFRPWEFSLWYILPLSALTMTSLGLGLGALLYLGRLAGKKHLLPLAAMQNAGYFVLPLGLALYPDQFERFALLTFLFILGNNLLLWSVGKGLAAPGPDATRGRAWRELLNPPFLANLSAVILVLSGAARFLPEFLLNSTRLLGSAAVPVATFILGAVLGSVPLRFRDLLGDALRLLGVKLLLLPLLVFILLRLFAAQLEPLLADFLIIQAAVAPAVGIILQVRHYGGDEERIGALMFLSYAVSLFTVPLWIGAWRTWGF